MARGAGYGEQPDDFWRIHKHCTCVIEYKPSKYKRADIIRYVTGEDGKISKVVDKGRESGIIGLKTKDGHTVKNVKTHFTDRATERDVSFEEARDALTNPIHITDIRYNERGEASIQYVGGKATIAYNPETDTIITTWKTGKRL